MPKHVRRKYRGSAQLPEATRRRLIDAVERIIATLDAMDTPDEDLENGHDAEDDPAESGIADHDAYIEECVGEPSLGATHDDDQATAWDPDRLRGPLDGEATGTIDDIARPNSSDFQWSADRKAIEDARATGRELLRGSHRQREEV